MVLLNQTFQESRTVRKNIKQVVQQQSMQDPQVLQMKQLEICADKLDPFALQAENCSLMVRPRSGFRLKTHCDASFEVMSKLASTREQEFCGNPTKLRRHSPSQNNNSCGDLSSEVESNVVAIDPHVCEPAMVRNPSKSLRCRRQSLVGQTDNIPKRIFYQSSFANPFPDLGDSFANTPARDILILKGESVEHTCYSRPSGPRTRTLYNLCMGRVTDLERRCFA